MLIVIITQVLIGCILPGAVSALQVGVAVTAVAGHDVENRLVQLDESQVSDSDENTLKPDPPRAEV